MQDDALVAACRRAGEDLGIRVTAPCTVTTRAGQTYVYAANCPDFGEPPGSPDPSPGGLLLFDADPYFPRTEPIEELCEGGESIGCYTLGVRGADFVPYSRSAFARLLRRFAWLGAKGAEPAWYSVDPTEVTSWDGAA